MSVGLATENRLPKAYTATTAQDGQTVTIQSGLRSAEIDTNSFASVANILSEFAPDGKTSLAPGATLVIKDDFSGRSISVVACAIEDVANVLLAFVVEEGKYLPEFDPVQTSNSQTDGGDVAPVSPTQVVAEKYEERPVPAPVHSVAVDGAVQQRSSNDQQPIRKRGRPKKVVNAASEIAAPVQAAVEAVAPPPASTSAVVGKKRGRPRKSLEPVSGGIETSSEITAVKPVLVAHAETASENVVVPKKRGRPKKIVETTSAERPVQVNVAPPQVQAPGIVSAEPSKRRGRPPKVAVDVQDTAFQATEKVTPIKKAETSSLERMTPKLLGPAVVEDHRGKALRDSELPAFIRELDAFYIGESHFRLDFTPLKVDPAKRRNVIGLPALNEIPDAYGYEIKTPDGEHAGWVMIESENKFVMTGLPELDISNHKNIRGVLTRIQFAVTSKVNEIHARAA